MNSRKVLIANRGEIAVRILRACRALALPSAVVYSEADRDALHVRLADEAVCIGPAAPAASYLNVAAIIAAARMTQSGLVHPGYGFLSENPALAEACEAAGLTFVGPPSHAIRAMADKAAAKRLAEKLGVPVLPGYHGRSQDPKRLAREAAAIGYPLLVKAAAGGGGRGMRVVRTAAGLPEALDAARREATGAFGDGRLLLERYLERPRHIEIQLLVDAFGARTTLGERECSLQRRHQKVIEEAPAPDLTAALRRDLNNAAMRVAQAIGYVGAGTVEFLVDAGRRFYFMEMNTRLQVEHGVTELVWGVDLVQEQLRIALEGLMGFDPAALNPSGNAIECRIIAEDPGRGFTPSPGRLSVFVPPLGPGIRNDTGVAAGDEVSRHYDPMFAKLLVRGETREEALDRCRAALTDYAVLGVATNIPFLQHLLDAPAMRAGRLSTQLLEDELLPAFQAAPPVIPPEALIAAAAIDLNGAAPQPGDPWGALGRRRPGGRRLFAYAEGSVTLRTVDGGWQAAVDGVERSVAWEPEGNGGRAATVVVDGGAHRVWWQLTAAGISLSLGGRAHSFAHLRPAGFGSGARAAALHGERGLAAPMPAVVVRVLVQPGDAVQARQTLVVLEAMKMEHLIQSPAAGVVRRVHCTEGATVAEGAVLVEVGEP